jgi:hypothetical protein
LHVFSSDFLRNIIDDIENCNFYFIEVEKCLQILCKNYIY